MAEAHAQSTDLNWLGLVRVLEVISTQPVSDPSHVCLHGWNRQVCGADIGSEVRKPKCPQG